METVGDINDVLKLSMNLISGLFSLLMGMLLAILMIKDKEKIARFARRFTYANFKKEKADELCVVAKNSAKILHQYLECKLIEFVVLFVSFGIAYNILGLKFTWELALIICVFNFIPYVGIYIGILPALLITLIFDSINPAIYMTIVTAVIAMIAFNIVLPLVTGAKLKISALVVMSSIIIGGAMFGMIGMLLAPPIFAIISVVVMGNIEMKENHIKYFMELEKERELHEKEEAERLGLINSEGVAVSEIIENEISENKNSLTENAVEKDEEHADSQPKKKRNYKRKSAKLENQEEIKIDGESSSEEKPKKVRKKVEKNFSSLNKPETEKKSSTKRDKEPQKEE